jgi:hypothetical protein
MALDPNIPRWIKASVYQHITDLSNNAYPIYLNSYQGDSTWAELRMDGPIIENYEFASFRFDVTFNILATCFCGTDEYAIDRMVGILGTTLDNDICLYKYGTGPDDDQSMFGRLQQYPSKDRKVDIVNFGLITPDSKFKRSSIEASYTLWL